VAFFLHKKPPKSCFIHEKTALLQKIFLMSTVALERKLTELSSLPNLVIRMQDFLKSETQERIAFREKITEDDKVEFINGKIVMHSPAADAHNESVLHLATLSNVFINVHDLGKVRAEKALVELTRNDYEPDVAFWLKAKADKIEAAQNIYPAPDWVVEVLSKGSIKRDRVTKFEDYAIHGIAEYWIVDTKKQTVEQYILPSEDSEIYVLKHLLTIDDEIESFVIKGFKIPVRAIFDAKVNVETLQNILKNA
jgi:Uma2 family endonuclease